MSERERVEALAKVLTDWTRPHAIAEDVLASDWLRDLLAEAKANALREAADASIPLFNVHPLNTSNVVADWLRDRAANPYRETSKEPATPGRSSCDVHQPRRPPPCPPRRSNRRTVQPRHQADRL